MTKEIWLNLPAKDIQKTTDFFTKIGFALNTHAPKSETMASFKIGQKDFIVNFFSEEVFNSFTPFQIADIENKTECLISIDAESAAEVDEILEKAKAAGAEVYAKGGEKDGWMYGGGFTDLDNHKWNILFMDFSKFNQ
ncbi:VOC family protein [Pedobacter ureilyticus]|jgi:predicted lactoylglutathione lyase|uniref:VOC family protein n=1 Tax=Pedobacter ureilyticus TaxID=1393051 RepID=A0ABW9JBB5_9SPHI|nr:VOC family protein [Pedobacter helvus]